MALWGKVASMEGGQELLAERIIDTLNGGLGIFAREGKEYLPRYISPGVMKLLGLDSNIYSEALQTGAMYFVYPEDLLLVVDAIRKAMDEDMTVSVGYRMIRPNNGYIWVKGMFTRYPSNEGEDLVCGVFLPLSDDDDLKEQALDKTSSAVHIIDADTYELYYSNEAGFSIFGLPVQKYEGRKCYEVFFGRNSICQNCPNHLKTGTVLHHESRLPSGAVVSATTRFLDWRGHKVIIETGDDVTPVIDEQKRQQELFDNVPGGICLFNYKDGLLRPTIVSNAYRNVVGSYDDSRLSGGIEFLFSMVHPDDLPALQTAIARQEERMLHDFDHVCRVRNEKTGAWIYLHIQAKSVPQKEGGFAVYALFSDITQIKEAEEERAAEYARYRLVVDELDVAAFEWNLKKGTFIASPAYAKYAMSKIRNEDILSNSGPLETVHPDDMVALQIFFAETKNGSRKADVVLRLKLVNGVFH